VHPYAFCAVLLARVTTIEKLRHIPTSIWLNLAIFLISVFVVYRLWHTLKALNDYAPYIACSVMAVGVFFYWVYTRTEPAFLTPIVERMAPFFPSRAQQQEYVDRAKTHHE
jgi:amino acid transporter